MVDFRERNAKKVKGQGLERKENKWEINMVQYVLRPSNAHRHAYHNYLLLAISIDL